MNTAQKKRILYIITKSNFGGAQRYVYELAAAMKDRGHRVAVATGGEGELVMRLRKAEIETFTLENLTRDIKLVEEWRSLRALQKIILEWKPDIVHLNSSKAGALGAAAARLCGVPMIIFTAHGWAFLEDRSLLWKTAVWAASFVTALLVHRVITVSQNDAAHAPMFFLKNRCETIHTAIAPFDLVGRREARNALFTAEEQAAHAQDVWVVSIAELTANKNLEAGIHAVAEYNRSHRQQIFYAIAGDGELRETLLTLVREEGAETHVRLLGYLPDARTYLHAFDLFLLPSRKEGLPYALLEAGHAALPVIASNVGGIPEVIEHGKTGLLIDPKNHVTITKALKSLITDTELRTRVSAALHTHVETEYGLHSMVLQTEKIYAEQ